MEWLDPLQTAVLEEPPSPTPEPASGPETVRVVTSGNQRMEAEVKLSEPAIVIFSEIDYPGWEARANGGAIETVRAFGLLRAVALPAGHWRVEWRFNPVPVRTGLALSGLTILLVSFLLIRDPKWQFRRHREKFA
jgi:uncharacterized membrane protein YfhO